MSQQVPSAARTRRASAKTSTQRGDVAVGVRLVAVLARHAVVALGPVRRAGDDAVGVTVGQRGEHAQRVADMQGRGCLTHVDRGDHLLSLLVVTAGYGGDRLRLCLRRVAAPLRADARET